MFKFPHFSLEKLLNDLGFGMRGKLITLFVAIKVAPLFLLAVMAWWQFERLGEELSERTAVLAEKAKTALNATGEIAVADAIDALDSLAQEDIERMTTDAARQVAEFLYSRDADIRLLASLKPDKELYATFMAHTVGRLVTQHEWVLAPDGNSWVPANPRANPDSLPSSNKENNLNFRYRPPDHLEYEERPLYLEVAFIGLDGKQQIKVVNPERIPEKLLDISVRQNTYAKAETYFSELQKLKPGEIYVSDVIGTYVPSKLIGMYTPANAAKRGIPYVPEEEAFSGKENPVGKRFKGIVRWATPVVEKGRIVGYVTMALDHDHLMTFMDHITPSKERYAELSDAFEGNYAFIWDHKGRSIVHPRHHSIVGFDPETGEPQVTWLEDKIYDRWLQSGKTFAEFIVDEPTFVEQSITKKPAPALTSSGMVGLDCRYLNFAPQCTGWFDLTNKGGSGSFNILWSGLRKLTTAATIPYFTGQYAHSPRGFGFVAVGAGLEDFHRPATETGEELQQLISDTDDELQEAVKTTNDIIVANLADTALSLSLSTTLMMVFVVLIAVWMASAFTRRITFIISGMSQFRNGGRLFRFKAPIKDEMGVLCDSFDSMADSIEESVQGTLVITDVDTRIIYVNKIFLKAMKKRLEDVLRKDYSEVSFFSAENNPIICMKEGRESEVEYHLPSNAWYKGMAEEHKNSDGEIIGYIVVCTDVTSMVETQRRNEEQRALLDVIFSASPDLMWYSTVEQRYLAVNPRYASMCNKNPEDIVGSEVQDVLMPGKAKESMMLDAKVIENHTPLRTEEEISFPNGRHEIVESVRTPIFDPQGRVTGIMGVARDITERTNIAEALRRTQHELEEAVEIAMEANAAKSQFLANMSHEIRTPMNAILGLSYIAIQDNPPPVQRDMFQKIHSAATGLLGIINDILDFSKIEARKLDLEMATFSLAEQFASVLDLLHFRADEKHLHLSIRMSPEVQAIEAFIGDAGRVRQVLINLIGNAIKFTDTGGVIVEAEVEERKEGKVFLRVSVFDTGIGIEPHMLEYLFQAFSQADGSATRRFGGTGLGLVISKELVDLMGGRMWVESVPGRGSMFGFTLPLIETGEDRRLTRLEQPSDEGMENLRNKHVLLVEDNEINQLVAENILQQAGVVVTMASNGAEAVERIKTETYDLVLMDIQMPVMDGLEATKIIRKMPGGNVPIVAMTAHAMSDDHEKSLRTGMNDHITKPIDPDVLFSTLIRWIR